MAGWQAEASPSEQPEPAGRDSGTAAQEAAAPEAGTAAPEPVQAALPHFQDVPAAQAQQQQPAMPARVQGSDWEDRGLGFLAAALSIAIMAILGRRLLIIAGIDISEFF